MRRVTAGATFGVVAALALIAIACGSLASPAGAPEPTFQPVAMQSPQDPALGRAQERCATLLHGMPAASKDGNDLASACVRQQLARERQRAN